MIQAKFITSNKHSEIPHNSLITPSCKTILIQSRNLIYVKRLLSQYWRRERELFCNHYAHRMLEEKHRASSTFVKTKVVTS